LQIGGESVYSELCNHAGEEHGTIEDKAWSDGAFGSCERAEEVGAEVAWGWSLLGTGVFSPERDNICRSVK